MKLPVLRQNIVHQVESLCSTDKIIELTERCGEWGQQIQIMYRLSCINDLLDAEARYAL